MKIVNHRLITDSGVPVDFKRTASPTTSKPRPSDRPGIEMRLNFRSVHQALLVL